MLARRIFKILLLIFCLPLFAYLWQVNIRLYYTPEFQETSGGRVNKTLLKQLQFLKGKLHAGAGAQMQQVYPEGHLFIHTLYGLAWCNALKPQSPQSDLFQEGLQEIDWALTQVESDEAKAVFQKNLLLEYGAFYQGWTNYLLGQKLALQKPETRDSSELRQFISKCRQIATAFRAGSTPYLSSYEYGIWPADNVVCMAGLALHDRLFKPEFSPLIQQWLGRVESGLGARTGLIAHEADPNGAMVTGARGSSQSLILVFLPEIDTAFAKQQFEGYLRHFLDYRFGLPGIREYPKGFAGNGDIDSGPVVYDIGGAASIVGIAATRRLGRPDLSVQIRNAVEGIACPWENAETKRYFFGQVPMANVFLAWANSFTPAPDPPESHNWRWAFHGWSLLIGLGMVGFYQLLARLAR
jgi:hypothetical protein